MPTDHISKPRPDHMRRAVGRTRLGVVVASGSLVAASLLLPAAAVSASGNTSNLAAQQAAGQRLVANLRGTPTGDPNGTGRAALRLFKASTKVCATITWSRIGRPTSAHVHRADGTVIVDLTGSVTGGRRCDTTVRKAAIQRILDHPRRYYVNVHNSAFPAGAIRGPLHR